MFPFTKRLRDRQQLSVQFRLSRLRDTLTFFEASLSNLLRINSRLRKTWHTACFEPRSEDERFLRSKRFPSDLAGPGGQSIYYKLKKLAGGYFECDADFTIEIKL